MDADKIARGLQRAMDDTKPYSSGRDKRSGKLKVYHPTAGERTAHNYDELKSSLRQKAATDNQSDFAHAATKSEFAHGG